MKKEFVADFETCQDYNNSDTERVWLWCLGDVSKNYNDNNFRTGTNIEDFIEECCKLKYKDNVIFFHNLKFDGSFIINELIKKGFKWVYKPVNKLNNLEYTTNTTFLGIMYGIDLCYKNKRIHFRDSLKLFTSSEEQLAKDYNLPVKKGEIDYKKVRGIDYSPTPEEIEYVKNDVYIISYLLAEFRAQGYEKNTASSSAFNEFLLTCFPSPSGKRSIRYSLKSFKGKHPITPEQDKKMRESYHGGLCWLNPKYKNRDIGKGRVYDTNSMYSSVMYDELMPYGEPMHGEGKPFTNDKYNLYICKIIADFKVKEGCIPFIPNTHKRISWLGPNDVIDDTEGNKIEVWINSVDLEMMYKTYDFYYLEYIEYYSFKSKPGGFFRPYIDKFINKKIEGREEGNEAKALFAKMFLNGLYGKMGTRTFTPVMKPELNEKGKLHFIESDTVETEPLYVPLASFITAYARRKLLNAIYANKDRFIYCDTDSIHLEGNNPANGIEIDNNKLGAWKCELIFSQARFLGRKMYIERNMFDDKLKVCCAGLSRTSFNKINFDNFKYGNKIDNLKCVTTINGKRLENSEFEFKER